MKTHKFLVIAALIAHGLITACSSTSGGSLADKPGYNDRKQAFTENDLANAIYRINELGAFKLDNGEFKRQYRCIILLWRKSPSAIWTTTDLAMPQLFWHGKAAVRERSGISLPCGIPVIRPGSKIAFY